MDGDAIANGGGNVLQNADENVGTGGDAIPNGGGNILQNADENVGIRGDAIPHLIPNNEGNVALDAGEISCDFHGDESETARNVERPGWTRGKIINIKTGREEFGWVRWVHRETPIKTFFIEADGL